jgi:hypothetical protein
MMATRATRRNRLSSACAWQWKFTLEHFAEIPAEKVEGLRILYPEWIKVIQDRVAAKENTATGIEVSKDLLMKFSKQIWDVFTPIIEEGADRVMESERQRIGRIAEKAADPKYQVPRNQMSQWDRDFLLNVTIELQLSKNPESLKRHLERTRKDFVDSEKGKVTNLFYRIFSKVQPTDVRPETLSGRLVSFRYDTDTEKNALIEFRATPAGGYNIQRFHYRWLATFYAGGQQYEFKSTDKNV